MPALERLNLGKSRPPHDEASKRDPKPVLKPCRHPPKYPQTLNDNLQDGASSSATARSTPSARAAQTCAISTF